MKKIFLGLLLVCLSIFFVGLVSAADFTVSVNPTSTDKTTEIFTFTITNNAHSSSINETSITLPNGFSFVDSSGNYSDSDRKVTWTDPNLISAGNSKDFWIKVNLPTITTSTNYNFTVYSVWTDVSISPKSKNVTVTINPVPPSTDFCEYGPNGTYLDVSIVSPEEDDEFLVGDEVEIEVDVDNNYDKDLKIEVEADLYDLTDYKSVENTKLKETIKADETETYFLKFEIPTGSKLNEDHDFKIRVKVYKRGDEDKQCSEDSVGIIINREDQDVRLKEGTFSPDPVECGLPYSFKGKILNAGSEEQDKIKVTYEDDLGNKDEEILKNIRTGRDKSISFDFTAPINTTIGEHTATLRVYYDYYDENYDESRSFTFKFNVSGNCFVAKPDVSISAEQNTRAIKGSEFSIKITLKNTGNVETVYKTEIFNYENWSTLNKIVPKEITLKENQTGYVYVYLNVNENASESESLRVKVTYDDKTKEIPLTITVTPVSKPITKFLDKIKENWPWALVFLVMIIIIIILIVLLTKKPGREESEEEIFEETEEKKTTKKTKK